MKKLFALLMALTLLLCSACGAKEENPEDSAEDPNAPTESVDTQKNDEEQKTLIGSLDEVKDFMIVVTDENGTSYALSFNDAGKPEGLSDVSVGEKVEVTYTGELSAVDVFEGSVLSVKAAE